MNDAVIFFHTVDDRHYLNITFGTSYDGEPMHRPHITLAMSEDEKNAVQAAFSSHAFWDAFLNSVMGSLVHEG